MEKFCSGCQKQLGHVCRHLQFNKLSMIDGYGSHKVGKTASFFCTIHNRSLYDAFGTTLQEKIGLFHSSSWKVVPVSPNASYDLAWQAASEI
jgi:hypothetical protein